MYKLTFDKGSLKGRTVELVENKTVLGRGAECQVELLDDGVSRQHCYIEQRDDGVYICDMGSTNGIYVNGKKTPNAKLNPGDHIRIGSAAVFFEKIGAAAPAPEKSSAADKTPPSPPPPQKIAPSKPAPRSAMPAAPAPSAATNSNLPMIVAIIAVIAVVGLSLWVGTLNATIGELKKELSALRVATGAPPNVVMGRDASTDNLRQEINELKQQIQRLKSPGVETPPPNPAVSPETPKTPNAVEGKANQSSVSPALPKKIRILQVDKDESPDSQSITVTLKIRPEFGEVFETAEATVVISFFEKTGADAVEENRAASKILRAGAEWRDLETQRLNADYTATAGRKFYGFVARTYYKSELQDEVVRPQDLPPEMLARLAAPAKP